jgi:hypothetical protein
MDALEFVRLVAAVTTVMAALMVALNISAPVTVLGFGVFTFASLAWMVDGWFDDKALLFIQNAALLLIDLAGIYRWLPRAKADE